MKKNDFLRNLKVKLVFLDKNEKDEIIGYYDELIQDAIDNNEDEDQFILGLGKIDELVHTIEKDDTFVQKVIEKRAFNLGEAASTTVKVIGYFFFAILAFTVACIAFSFVVSGIAVDIQAIIQLIVDAGKPITVQIMILGKLAIGLG